MWPDIHYKNWNKDNKKRTYYFQCRHAGKKRKKRK